MTRVSDNKHHWGDVVGGVIIGAIGTLFTVCYFNDSKNLKSTVCKHSSKLHGYGRECVCFQEEQLAKSRPHLEGPKSPGNQQGITKVVFF